MKPLIMPQISLNGTTKNQLLEQQLAVLDGCRKLVGAMIKAAPHGRDYQHRPEEYIKACDAWCERVMAIETIHREIEAHAHAISDKE